MKKNLLHNKSGFTLLEIMLVVLIIGLLIGAATTFFQGNLGLGQDTRVDQDVQAFSTALKMYEAINGSLPTTQQGLRALVERPTTEPRPRQWRKLMEKIPLDPYNNEYVYSNPGEHNPDSFDVFSKGKKPEDPSDDRGNWDASAQQQ